jgi:hypothetical protein
MKKQRQGHSIRGIARAWGVSAVYAWKFIHRIGLEPFADGSYDLAAATLLRTQRTRAGQWITRNRFVRCPKCGAGYVSALPR